MQANEVEIAKVLLAFDADLNVFNRSHKTPLDLVSYSYPDSELNGILERLNGKTYAKLYEEEGMNFHVELKQSRDLPPEGLLVTSVGYTETPLEHIDGVTEGIVFIHRHINYFSSNC